ncbi:arylsulfatase [candidate division KSB1 bacterium]|nr:arylsulfatase [candidate division KSB1 bacterium]
MNRRQFIRATSTAAGSAILGSCARQRLYETPKKPNIIYILADDLGYGDLGCYGQTKIRTPHLDQMAAEGMRFTNHYSGSTVCAPSRCCLMTGLHTGHTRVRGNYESGPHGFGACLELRPEDVTVAELLQQGGYKTGAFGKWSLGIEKTTGAPWKQGFDQFFGYLNQGNAHRYYPDFLWENDQKVELPENLDGQQSTYSHDLIIDRALDFIQQNKTQPFFLYLAIAIPHADLLVPDDSLQEYLGQFEETPYKEKFYKGQSTPKAAFAGMITRMDRDVGRLFALLKSLSIDEDTIVIFSSDNGPHKEGGADPDFFQSAGSFRGYKRDLYEGGIRVPMIARWPGRIQPGQTSDHPSAFWDFLPMACELANQSIPDGIDGISILPSMTGKSQKKHDYLYWEFHENSTTSQAIRYQNWKGVRHAPNGPLELYDLKTDHGEERNVVDKHPEVYKQLTAIFDSARTDHELWPLKYYK